MHSIVWYHNTNNRRQTNESECLINKYYDMPKIAVVQMSYLCITPSPVHPNST